MWPACYCQQILPTILILLCSRRVWLEMLPLLGEKTIKMAITYLLSERIWPLAVITLDYHYWTNISVICDVYPYWVPLFDSLEKIYEFLVLLAFFFPSLPFKPFVYFSKVPPCQWLIYLLPYLFETFSKTTTSFSKGHLKNIFLLGCS